MYILREYQKEAVSKAVDFFKSPTKGNAIEVLPTGSGKSLIIANIVKELGEKTLVFQPSKEILEQNFAKLICYGYNASIFSASLGSKEISDITFATIGSVINKKELFQGFKYIIVDECHLVNSKGGMYEEFINGLGAKVLGLTATPYRLVTDGFGGSILKFLTRTRPRVFKSVIYYIQNKELFDAGYLARLKYFPINGFDRSQLQLNTTGADYTDASVQRYYESVGFSDKVLKCINRLIEIGRKNILVFTRFVDESQYLVNNIPDAAIVTAESNKKERESVISGFRSGRIKVVCNVGILTTGFDYPELETIVLARPTMSLALYYQMIGRGIRPHQDKDHTMVVDLCNNIDLFGNIEDLTLLPGENGKWAIYNKNRQLTNVYYQR
jgi:DNA repair protein RadD